eukprot:927351-Rhodomonas_salina.1
MEAVLFFLYGDMLLWYCHLWRQCNAAFFRGGSTIYGGNAAIYGGGPDILLGGGAVAGSRLTGGGSWTLHVTLRERLERTLVCTCPLSAYAVPGTDLAYRPTPLRCPVLSQRTSMGRKTCISYAY